MNTVKRVLITPSAQLIVQQLQNKYGNLIFHQSGGCCDGSAPMCFPEGELMINEMDVLLGTISGCNFYMSIDQFEYWQYSQLTIDVVKGRGASFSLETSLGIRFITQSRLFTEEEITYLCS
jgi:uncharacterized protein (DUF779 family)